MNATSTVISVDPRSEAIGLLHPEATARIARRSYVRIFSPAKSRLKSFLNIFFGFSSRLSTRSSLSILLLRIAFAAVLICTTLFSDAFATVALPYEMWIAVGVCFALGFSVRLVAIASAAFFSLIIAGGALFGSFDPFMAASLSISLFIAICGPGRYSIDAIMRGMIFGAVHNSKRRCRRVERSLSYRAYSQIHK